MAHSCPDCGVTCHCGGDIDDCCFEGTPEERACLHCPDGAESDDEDDPNENRCPRCASVNFEYIGDVQRCAECGK